MSDRNPTTALIVGAAGDWFGVCSAIATNRVERVYTTHRNPNQNFWRSQSPSRCLPLDITEEAQIATVMKEIQNRRRHSIT